MYVLPTYIVSYSGGVVYLQVPPLPAELWSVRSKPAEEFFIIHCSKQCCLHKDEVGIPQVQEGGKGSKCLLKENGTKFVD
jgi:hypothetical protein